MTERLVVIGAGMAAGRLLEHLTQSAPRACDITVFNTEPRGSYNRIMLSPVLAGETSFEQIVTHADEWYAARGITCRWGEPVHRIDPEARRVYGAHGVVAYDRLVIATGSTPVMLPLPGADLAGVTAYRDLEDTQQMMALRPGARAVVIGGGLLGLEAAAGMAARGVAVSVVHLMGHLMERQLDPEAGALLKAALARKGVDVILEAASEEITGAEGRVTGLRLADGRHLPCDLLVMAAGVRPNVALAQEAGLQVARGIVVDDQMRTSAPGIFALGECVEHNGQLFGLVAPLFDQAQVLAETLTGAASAFHPTSMATRLKVTGCDVFSAGDFAEAPGREDILYRDPAGGVYKRLVIEHDRLVGVVLFGDTTDGAWYHRLIEAAQPIGALRAGLVFGAAYAAAMSEAA